MKWYSVVARRIAVHSNGVCVCVCAQTNANAQPIDINFKFVFGKWSYISFYIALEKQNKVIKKPLHIIYA